MRWLAWLFVAACASTSAPAAISPSAPTALPQVEATADLDGARVGASTAPATIVIVFASWCEHCRAELDVIARLRAQHPALRVLGANYKGHEEYDHRGSASAVRAYVAANAPWLRVVPIDDAVFAALGRPPMVPTMFVYDHAGALIGTFDRRERTMPDAAELDALLRRLGA